jgi:ArsR family transcriptional regulator
MTDNSNLRSEVNELHAHICQALADPTRILILYALHDRPRNVTELAEDYEIPQPTVSRHLKALRDRGLVISQRQGNAVLYSLRDERVMRAQYHAQPAGRSSQPARQAGTECGWSLETADVERPTRT